MASRNKIVLPVSSLVSVFLLWHIVAKLLDSWKLPDPVSVLLALASGRIEVLVDIAYSLYHLALGLCAGLFVGFAVGAIMGWSRTAEGIIGPVVEFVRPIPPLAWIPFAIIWLKLSHWSAGFIVFVGIVFPILINTYTGFKNTPRVLIEAACVLGCTKHRQLMLRVALPSALPSILSGIRIGVGIGWMCLVASEIFGQTKGLGFKLWYFYQLHQMDKVTAYMLLLGSLGFLFDYCFRSFIESKALIWQEGLVR